MGNISKAIASVIVCAVAIGCGDVPTASRSPLDLAPRRDATPGQCGLVIGPDVTVPVNESASVDLSYLDCDDYHYYPAYGASWYVGNSAVASISPYIGPYTNVTGVSVGSTVVYATLNGYSSAYASVGVTAQAALATLTVTPSTANGTNGQTRQISVSGRDQYNRSIATGTVTYSSGNTSVATVSSTGLITFQSTAGTTSITVAAGSVTSSVTANSYAPLSASMSTDMPGSLISTGTYTWQVYASNGVPGYTYSWQRKGFCESTFYDLGEYGNTYTQSTTYGDDTFYLRAIVTDSLGNTTYVDKRVGAPQAC